MYSIQFTTRHLEVASSRGTGSDNHSIEVIEHWALTVERYFLTKLKLNALSLHEVCAALDDILVELEVRNAITKQTSSSCTTLVNGDIVALGIEAHSCGKTCRSCTHNCYTLAVALVGTRLHISFTEGFLNNTAFVLTYGDGLIDTMIEHTSLLAEGRTDAPCEFRERIRGDEQLVSQFPFAFIYGILPFGLFVTQRTCPMAEWNSTLHAAAGLQTTIVLVERLLHLCKVFDSLIYWSVPCFLTGYSQKCFRISHDDNL